MSSYDELVHEPIKPTSTFIGQPFFSARARTSEMGVAKSGVKGPLRWGSKVDRSISMTWSKYVAGSA